MQEASLYRRKTAAAIVLIGLALALVGAALLAVQLGAVRVGPLSLVRLLAGALGLGTGRLPAAEETAILLYIRLPRVTAAMLVGAALSLGGVVMQGLFRNPMASPDILGVSTGGSLGAVVAISTGLFALNVLFLPLLAVLGALVAASLIYLISRYRGRTSLLFVVLAGLAVSSLFNGLVSAILMFARQYEVSQFIFWTMGGLDGRTWRQVTLPLPVLLPGMAFLFFFARDLNLFALGEEGAHSLGMQVERTKRLLLAVTAVVTGVAISISGPVGFVGLLVPHLFRMLVGPDHRILLPVSALGGALFLVLSDLVGRVLAPPFEIRVGIITAVLGSPYFLYLIVRYQRRGMGGRAARASRRRQGIGKLSGGRPRGGAGA
ncbi:MAG: iron ABC transporter permease [Spirochaetales bacterium]|nr:iron ABC transporter permease [Spirochaetales bacterium]